MKPNNFAAFDIKSYPNPLFFAFIANKRQFGKLTNLTDNFILTSGGLTFFQPH